MKCNRHQQQSLATGNGTGVAGVRLFTSKEKNCERMEAVSSDDLKTTHEEDNSDSYSNFPEAQIPGAQTGGKKLAIVFTCKVCETRSVKQFTEQAYQNGVVMARCPGCENLHLIADRLGFFEDESWDIEKAMARMGEEVKAINDDNVLELTLKDVIGDKIENQSMNNTSSEDDSKVK